MSNEVQPLGDLAPSRGNAISRFLAGVARRLTGWRIEGALPNLPKFVIIVAPHTSNWDFMVGLMAMFSIGIRGGFFGKHTLFRGPMGWAMRWLGGIPVIRTASHNKVDHAVQYFSESTRFVLALSPEGTRKKLPAWRTGFYYVAKGAGVPIVPVAFDYSERVVRIFAPVVPSGEKDADFAHILSLFSARMAKYPAQY